MRDSVFKAVDTPRRGRGLERIRSRAHGTLVHAHSDDFPPIPVTLHDLSEGGAGMESALPLPIGTPVVLVLPLGERVPLSLRGHIATCVRVTQTEHRLGMQFDVTSGPSVERIREVFFSA